MFLLLAPCLRASVVRDQGECIGDGEGALQGEGGGGGADGKAIGAGFGLEVVLAGVEEFGGIAREGEGDGFKTTRTK